MHLPFVIQGPFAFRQDAKLGSFPLVISKKKHICHDRICNQHSLVSLRNNSVKGQQANNWIRMDSVDGKYRKFLLLLWLGSGEQIMNNEASSANAEKFLKYAVP